MNRARAILFAAFGLALTVPVRGQGEVLMREVVSREYGINVGAVQDPAIKSLVSREVGIFVGEEPAPPHRQVISREVSLAVADESAPPRIGEIAVTVSPTGSTVTLDWSGYNHWQVRDVKHYAVYYSTSPIVSVAGAPYQIVAGEQLSVTLTGLAEWQDHFFAVVPVDALDHFDPVVNYAAAYVLMPEVVSREVAVFIGAEPDPPYRQAVSREVSLVVADPAPPPRITDFTVTASPTGSSVSLNWSSYNQFAVRDVARYDIYYSTSAFTDISAMTPYATVGGEIFEWSHNGLPEWQDHFFAVVPVDGMGNKDPQVLYSAAYVLMPEVVSREVGLFIGAEPDPPYRQVVSREVSLVVADDTVPAPVTGPTSGFVAFTAPVTYSAVVLDWSTYPIWTQRDVVRYRIYYSADFFNNVNAPGVIFHGFSQDGGSSATVSGLPAEAILYFAVVAEDSSGQFDPVVYAMSAKTSVGQLGDVANLQTTASRFAFSCRWDLGGVGDELAGFVHAFHVYFNGSTTPIVRSKTSRSWNAYGLQPSTTYTVRVCTVDVLGLESEGEVIQATTLPVLSGDYIVDFEGVGESKPAYASGNVTLSGIPWNLNEVLIGGLSADWKNNLWSARLRGYASSSMTMLQDKQNGAGMVSFFYRRYGNDAQVPWEVECSKDSGATWSMVGTPFTANENVQHFLVALNETGNVRVRIVSMGAGMDNRRMNIDDFKISDYPAPDIQPPLLLSVHPGSGEDNVALSAKLKLVFDEPILPGSGMVKLYESGSYLAVESWPADAGVYDIASNSVQFNPSGLVGGKSYYVLVDGGAFRDAEGNPCEGLHESNLWTFMTGAQMLISYNSWKSVVGDQTPDEDYDGDGIANGVEFFMGTRGDVFDQNPAVHDGEVVWPRNPQVEVLGFRVEGSVDLLGWEDVTLNAITTIPDEVRYVMPLDRRQWFVRLVVVP